VTTRGASAGGARDRCSPYGADLGTAATAAATADRPTAPGLAKVTSASETPSARHRARDPTHRSAVTATSTSALSRRSPTVTSSRLARRTSPSPPSRPVATSPVARPATVASRSSGKALLVPVDSAHRGRSPQWRATTRQVPSPPSTTIAATPRSAMARTAAAESPASSRTAMSSTSSSGRGRSASRPVRPRRWRWRLAETPEAAGIITTRSTPAAPSPAMSRWTMAPFSALSNTDAPVTSRRTSRPDAGLATTPTLTMCFAYQTRPNRVNRPNRLLVPPPRRTVHHGGR
jgi:hypothetical protein